MTTFLSIWAAVGPLIGVLLGGYLTMRVQRNHWKLDNKKEEYRELIGTLTQSFNVIMDFHAPMVGHGPEEQRAAHGAHLKALAVLGDRLFIADEIKRLDLRNRWNKVAHEIEAGGHSQAFARGVVEIMDDITASAKQTVS